MINTLPHYSLPLACIQWYGDTMYSVCKHKGPIQWDTENQYTWTKFMYKGPIVWAYRDTMHVQKNNPIGTRGTCVYKLQRTNPRVRWPWRSRDQTLYDKRFLIEQYKRRSDSVFEQRSSGPILRSIPFRDQTISTSATALTSIDLFLGSNNGLYLGSNNGLFLRSNSGPFDQPNVLWDI